MPPKKYVNVAKIDKKLYGDLDVKFYRENNTDLEHLTDNELILHYVNRGKKEGRHGKPKSLIKEKNKLNKIDKELYRNLDIEFYKKNNPDIKHFTDNQLILHYVKSGKEEGRLANVNPKICLVYVYYERKNDQTNQTNLAFFLKYALDKSRWRNVDITTIIIITGKQCELVLPDRTDINILNSNVDCDDTTSLYDECIYFMKNKSVLKMNQMFTHLIITNVNFFGPMYNDGKDNHWIDPLMNDMSIRDEIANIVDLPVVINLTKYTTPVFGICNQHYIKQKLNYNLALFDISDYKASFNKTNNKCLVYAHYDKDNIIKQYVLATLYMFAELGYDIIFYTNSAIINNYDEHWLPFKINYFCGGVGAGTDWYMWLTGCKEIQNRVQKYQWIALINDSMLVGINGIENMKETINKMEQNDYDLWGHWDSSEINYHIMSSFYEFRYNVMEYFIEFCENNLFCCKTKEDVIYKCETQFTTYLKSHNFKTGAVVDELELCACYDKNTVEIHTASHHPILLNYWINKPASFGIKWKYVVNHLEYLTKNDRLILNNEIKERLRFINIGKCKNINSIFQSVSF